jgi:hypothetical protein
MAALTRVKLNWAYRLAAVCLVNPSGAHAVCRALKVSNTTRKTVTDLVMLRSADLNLVHRQTIFQLMSQVGKARWADFLAFRAAVEPREAALVERLTTQAKNLMVEEVPLKTTALAIDGKTVMEMLDLKPSALIGLILNGALAEIWCGRLTNERSDLITALPTILEAVQGES